MAKKISLKDIRANPDLLDSLSDEETTIIEQELAIEESNKTKAAGASEFSKFLLPRSTEAMSKGETPGTAKKLLDIASAPLRSTAAIPSYIGGLVGSGGNVDVARKQWLEDAKKVKSDKGGIAGVIEDTFRSPVDMATMAATGGTGILAKKAGESAIKAGLKSIGSGAISGAAPAAASSTVEALEGDKGIVEGAKNIAAKTAAGGILGGAVGGAGTAIAGAGKMLLGSESRAFADKIMNHLLGTTNRNIDQKAAMKALQDNNLYHDPELIYGKAVELVKGKKAQFDEAVSKVTTKTDMNDIMKDLSVDLEKNREKYTTIIGKTKKGAPLISGDKMQKALKELLGDPINNTEGILERTVGDLNNMTLAETQKLKLITQTMAEFKDSKLVTNDEAKIMSDVAGMLYSKLKKRVESNLDKETAAINNELHGLISLKNAAMTKARKEDMESLIGVDEILLAARMASLDPSQMAKGGLLYGILKTGKGATSAGLLRKYGDKTKDLRDEVKRVSSSSVGKGLKLGGRQTAIQGVSNAFGLREE